MTYCTIDEVLPLQRIKILLLLLLAIFTLQPTTSFAIIMQRSDLTIDTKNLNMKIADFFVPIISARSAQVYARGVTPTHRWWAVPAPGGTRTAGCTGDRRSSRTSACPFRAARRTRASCTSRRAASSPSSRPRPRPRPRRHPRDPSCSTARSRTWSTSPRCGCSGAAAPSTPPGRSSRTGPTPAASPGSSARRRASRPPTGPSRQGRGPSRRRL